MPDAVSGPDLRARINQPGGLFNPGWFRIEGGDHDGRLHISGWWHSAVKGEQLGRFDDGWLAFAVCPVCKAMVVADGHNAAHGDHTWAHERWHARTDFPVPAGLLTDEDRKAGYGTQG